MFKSLILSVLKTYKSSVSPILVFLFGHSCRFSPSCSEYAHQAIKKYGVLKGFMLFIFRLVRCNPMTRSTYDPVV